MSDEYPPAFPRAVHRNPLDAPPPPHHRSQTMNELTPYSQGWEARNEGKRLHHNPYDKMSDKGQQWRTGWLDSKSLQKEPDNAE